MDRNVRARTRNSQVEDFAPSRPVTFRGRTTQGLHDESQTGVWVGTVCFGRNDCDWSADYRRLRRWRRQLELELGIDLEHERARDGYYERSRWLCRSGAHCPHGDNHDCAIGDHSVTGALYRREPSVDRTH